VSKRKYICRGCDKERQPNMYFCRTCWFSLPMVTRKALLIEDDVAFRRLAWVHGQIRNGVPLSEIRIGKHRASESRA
jgi:hypothetical protein